MTKAKISSRLTNPEQRKLLALSTPHKVQTYIDSLPYRAEDIYPPPVAVLRDNRAHCFDGALFSAAALRRTALEVFLINLKAVRDDDHLLCAFKIKGYWGAVAKSNFPGLRYREPIFKTPRELVMSYFEFYFNLKGEKSLREFSEPLSLDKIKDYSWEWNQEAVDELADRLAALKYNKLISSQQAKKLRRIDKRLFASQMLGVNKKGVVHS